MAFQDINNNTKPLTDFELAITGSSLFEGGDLGSGSFGKVKRVRDKQSGDLYAMKIINKDMLKSQKYHDLIKREIDIQKSLDHPNLVKLHYHLQDKKKIYLIMELAENGSLYDSLRKKRRFKEAEAFEYFNQILTGLEYLHKNNIMHRDLKPENILFDRNRNIKICDFGWSAETKTTRLTYCGTVEYLAPEIAKNLPYDHRVDIWSLGILLYEMLHGCLPFQSKRDGEKDGKTDKCLYIRFKKSLSQEACDLIKKLLKPNPTERIALSDILLHPWMMKYTSKKVEDAMDSSMTSSGLHASKVSTESDKVTVASTAKSDGLSQSQNFDGFSTALSSLDESFQKKKKVSLLKKLAKQKTSPFEEVIDYDSRETLTVLETIFLGFSCICRGSKDNKVSE